VSSSAPPLQALPLDQRRLSPAWDSRRIFLVSLAVASVAVSLWSLRFLEFSPLELYRGLRESTYFSRALPPVFNDPSAPIGQTLYQLWRTFLIALAGTGLAAIMSIPVGVLAARNTSPHPAVVPVARGFITAMRAIPDVVMAVIFALVLQIGEKPGVLAIGFHSIGMLGKLLADRIEEIDEGPREASQAAGAGRIQSLFSSVLPQVGPSYVSNLIYRLDINVRVSVVLGIVGAGGIGFLIQTNIRNPLRYQVGIGMALLAAGLILIVDMISNRLRATLERIDSQLSREARDSLELKGVKAVGDGLQQPWTRERVVLQGFAAVSLLGWLYAILAVGLHPWRFVAAIWQTFTKLHLYIPPDFTTHWDALRQGLIDSLAVSVAATFLGLVFGIPFGFLVARVTTPHPAIGFIGRSFQVVLRCIPDIVIALALISAIGITTPLPGAVALSLGTFGFVSKLVGDSLEGIPRGPLEGVRATGATHGQEVAGAALPQAVPFLVGHALYGFDVVFRSSVILGQVAGIGIGRIMQESSALLEYETLSAAIVMLFVVVFAVELLGNRIRKLVL
jgi:phosphonate transport system permease protein